MALANESTPLVQGFLEHFAVDRCGARRSLGRMANRFVVIMAGGRGERFWPQSRLARPKHLLPIVGESALLVQTIERLLPMIPAERVLIITNRQQSAAIAELCPMLPAENIVAEPVGRDTAAAVGLALVLVRRRDPQATFAMLPADHVIHDTVTFRADLERAFTAAEREPLLVTLGIKPTEPATGFGYIQRGAPRSGVEGLYDVTRFVEKPQLEVAKSYLAGGDYLWNAGMFFWRVPVVAAAFAQHVPDLWADLGKLDAALQAGQLLDAVLETIYPTLKRISVDYALIEKARNVAVIPARFDWDDVGAWPAVTRHFPADAAGNVVRGLAAVEQATGNLVVSTPDHLVAVLGVQDLIVVHTADATLICPKGKAQEIKALLKRCESAAELKRFL
jgi:mannose-1-phosphate guanylyltransferase